MLEVRDLAVQYGRVAAVRGVSLHVGEGEVVGLIGPNGAGKTSVLSAIAGVVPAAAGSIEFEGRTILKQPPEAIVEAGISLVPEGRRIFATMTVADNLALGTTVRRDDDGGQAAIERMLELFPVLRRTYRSSAWMLSGGEQQQLAIARALLSNPRLLLLDEPSLGLAPLVVDQVFEVLDQLRGTGVTILLVEQVAARTAAFADRTYVLRTGTVAFSGTRDELVAQVDFAAAYLGVEG
jgi:branched-chain amino acid transport system ATP-binding protein